MVDMAVAFGVFANSGVKVPLQPILKVETYQGETLEKTDIGELSDYVASQALDWNRFWEESAKGSPQTQTIPPTPTPTQTQANFIEQVFNRTLEVKPAPIILSHPADGVKTVLPEEVAYIISHILLDNNARTGAFGPNSELVIKGKTVSVKTGTTNDLRDNWTIGFNPDYLVSVWVGNNDGSPMSYIASGVTGASPIWHDIMTNLLKGQPDHFPAQPQGVVTAQVCTLTGLLPTQDNPCDARTELFIKGQLPDHNYPNRRQIWIRRDNNLPLMPGDNVIDLNLEEHLVVSDPLVSEFCLDCQWPQTPDPTNADPNRIKINYPILNVDYDRLRSNPPRPVHGTLIVAPTPTP
jgi:membrane carboxypeptidase/penicillin-binding protein